MIRFLILGLGLIGIMTLGIGCASSDILAAKKPAPPDDPPVQQPSALNRDLRPDDDNVLAMLESKSNENKGLRQENAALQKELDQKKSTAVAANERETRLLQDIERIEGLLKDATAKRRELEEQLLRSRIETVRAERELYKAQIDALATAPIK